MTAREHDVVVVGGGTAGLACAHRLRERDIDAVVLEAKPEPGGNVRTIPTPEGYRLEAGPHTFLGSADAIFELARTAGLADHIIQPRPEAKARFIVRDGRLHGAPMGPMSFLTSSLLSLRGKLVLAGEPWRRRKGSPDDTAAQFFERRFGREAGRVLAGAFISGVYAGDPEQLSAAAAFPLFWGFEQETGSMIRGAMRHGRRRRAELAELGKTLHRGLFSFNEGLGQLTTALADGLGDCCHLGQEVRAVRGRSEGFEIEADETWRARAVVVAAPPRGAAGALESLDPELAELLSGIPMAPVAVVHLGFEKRLPEIPEGFGFLVPRDEGIRTLGVLFPSRLFDGRAPVGGDLLAGFVGGVTDPGALELGDEELREVVCRDLDALTGLKRAPDFVTVRRYQQAIPQLVVGHLERMARVRERLAGQPGLFLAGNYLRGVGMKDAAASGLGTAATVAAYLP